ncbi:MAG: hypothetical protein HUU55_04970 [Myxococcales bacterium]|nr:hypothetical protein [Myxococcales bacterium]
MMISMPWPPLAVSPAKTLRHYPNIPDCFFPDDPAQIRLGREIPQKNTAI